MGNVDLREQEPRHLLHAAGVVILDDRSDKVLLVCQKKLAEGTVSNIPGMYGLPSGIKKPSQSLERNGVDVTKEETGIEANPEDLREIPDTNLMPALIRRTNENVLEILMHAYLHVGTQDIEPLEETSTTTIQWVSREELRQLEEEKKLLPNVRRVVEKARKFKKQLNFAAPISVDWVYRSDSPVATHALSERGMQAVLDRGEESVIATFTPLAPAKDIYSYTIERSNDDEDTLKNEGSRSPDRLHAAVQPKVDWWITEYCNYTCDFCWVDTLTISKETGWKRIMKSKAPIREEIATAIAKSDAEDVTLCGGEPLLVDPLEINKYGRMWRESGKKVTINTNASLLENYFNELKAAGEKPAVDRIKISIDGADDEGVKNMRGPKANFECIIEGVQRAKELGIEAVLTTMVGSQNKGELPRIAKVIKTLQPASWRFLEYSNRENTGERHTIEREEFERWAEWASIAVAPIPVYPSDNDLSEGCFIIDHEGFRQTPSGDTYIKGVNCREIPINEAGVKILNLLKK
jgi:sulfatase maturation enzyme AslB (radical SAM superfamily)